MTEAETVKTSDVASRGNWGLYVRPGRIDQIEITGGREPPAHLTVEWT